MPGPLSNIRVLDLSRVLAGPWASQQLADLGAQVIKIEKPGVGDDTRRWGPPYLASSDESGAQQSAYFLCANRGKQSVAIDFTRSEGQALIRELVVQSDVVLENYKVGGLKKYNLDYASLKLLNPKLIYCSITGFGQTGPYAGLAGYDHIIQAMGGIMSITGEADAQGDGVPQKVGVAVADVITGMYASTAILAAMHHRHATGKGQYIDLALLDCQIAMLANQNMNFLIGDEPPKRMGNAHPNIVPYQTFATQDGYIVLAIGNDDQFARFCLLIGKAELSENTAYSSNADRVKNRQTLVPIISEVLLRQSSAHWLARFRSENIPCGPINDLQQVFADPQVRHRQLQFELEHPFQGTIPQVANPIKYSDSPLEYSKAPPLLGEDTRQVLKSNLGLSDEAIDRLGQNNIIGL